MLELSASFFSSAGIKAFNEDFGGLTLPKGRELAQKGVCALVADGISGAPGGRDAAEYCGRNLLADYYATPDTWQIGQSLERIYQAMNRWILAQSRANAALAGMATTLTALVVRGSHYYFAHVGDTRLYRLRAGEMKCLTTDHVWQRPEMSHVLTRAIGLDSSLTVDHGMGSVAVGDYFLLLSDGVWAYLSETDIRALVEEFSASFNFDGLARKLCEAAIALGSTDNCSAVVLKVDKLGEDLLQDVLNDNVPLPVPRLEIGQKLDGMTVLEKLHASRRTELFKVQTADGRLLVLKTLSRESAEDKVERASLLHEAWLTKKLTAKFFPQVVEQAEAPSALYMLTTYQPGATLAKVLATGRHFTIPEVVNVGVQLARAIGALHRRGIVHRDIKPENIMLDDSDRLVLLDMGLAVSELGKLDQQATLRAGTPSYMAPELFENGEITPSTDLYAWGVTMYQLLIGKYPYGEIEAFQTPTFAQPLSILRYRPNTPGWLESIVLRAVATDATTRFETAEELLMSLERGPWDAPKKVQRMPLASRNKLRTWQIVSALSFCANILLLLLYLAKR